MEEINLKEVFDYFKSKILWIVIAIVAILIVGNVYTVITRVPMYESDTTIVLSGNKDAYSSTDSQINQNLIGTYREIIKSRNVLSQVIDNLDIKMSVDELANNITATSVEDTEIIRITVADDRAKDARDITDEVAKVFSDEVQDIYNLENVTIIDKADLANKPYNINYVKDNIIYLIAGIVLSFGVVFVMYYFDTSIKSSETIEEKFGLTVIGVVPEEKE
mgnify:FL=1